LLVDRQPLREQVRRRLVVGAVRQRKYGALHTCLGQFDHDWRLSGGQHKVFSDRSWSVSDPQSDRSVEVAS
jgi:hypothetical protein